MLIQPDQPSEVRERRGPGRPPSRTAEDFLDAARSAFSGDDAASTTMEEIAAHAGSTKPTLYKHFSSKDALLEATLERESARMKTHLFRAYESSIGLPLAGQLETSITAFADYARDNPQGFRMLFSSEASRPVAFARDELVESLSSRVTATVRRFAISHGYQMGLSAELMARMLVAIAVHTTQHAIFVAKVDPARISEMAIAFSDAAIRNINVEVLAAIDDAARNGDS